MADDPRKKADETKKSLKEVSEIVGALDEGFRELTSRLTDVVDEIKEGTRELTSFNLVSKDITRSLRSMSKINEDLIRNQIKLNQGKLSSKDIDEQINKAISTREILQGRLESIQKKIQEDTEDGAKYQEEIKKLQSQIVEISQEVEANFKKQRIEAEKLEKTLGFTGVILKEITKIPIVGQMVDTNKALQAAANAAKNGAGSFGAMGAALGSVGKDIGKTLMDPLASIALLVKGFKTFLDIGFKTDTQVTNLSKSMAISKEQATAIRNRFVEIQNTGQSLFETTENLVKAQLELADAFGATQGFSEQQVRDQVYLTKQIGLSADEAAGLQKLAMANGMTAKEVTGSVIKQTASLARQTGIQLDNKKILGEVAKVSGQLRLQYQNNPDLIAKAVVQTQKLGITLEQASKQAQHLLNFEESISDQISAELLTGKELNLERARLLALNGDVASASAEILSQVGSAAEFSRMNVIQQQALAKAVGMTADELANSLVQQENLSKLGGETKKQIQEQAEELRKKGMIDEANRLMASVGNEKEAQSALDRISAQDKFNAAMEKLQAMLVSIVEGPAMNFVNAIVRLVSDTNKLKGILTAIKAIAIAIAAAWVIMNPLAAVTGLAAAGAVMALSDGEVNNKGLVVGKYNKGQIQPIAQGAPEDNVIFTTNKPKANPTNPQVNIDMTPVTNKLDQVASILDKIHSKEGNVYQDSYKVGITQNMATYRV